MRQKRGKINQESFDLAKQLLKHGVKGNAVAKIVGVNPITVYRIDKAETLEAYREKTRSDFHKYARKGTTPIISPEVNSPSFAMDKMISLLTSILAELKAVNSRINDDLENGATSDHDTVRFPKRIFGKW